MPATSEKQRKLFGIAKSIKQGKTPKSYSPKAAKIAKDLPEKEIDKFATKEGEEPEDGDVSLEEIFKNLVREYRSK